MKVFKIVTKYLLVTVALFLFFIATQADFFETFRQNLAAVAGNKSPSLYPTYQTYPTTSTPPPSSVNPPQQTQRTRYPTYQTDTTYQTNTTYPTYQTTSTPPSSPINPPQLVENDGVLRVDLKLNNSDNQLAVLSGEKLSVTWTSSNALYCKGNWKKDLLKTGGKTIGKITASRAFTIVCYDGQGKTATDSIRAVISNSVPAPVPATVQAKSRDTSNPPDTQTYKLELDYPSYLPESFRHPRKFFSGRKIRVVAETGFGLPPSGVSLQAVREGSESPKIQSLKISAVKGNASVIEIPFETESGSYRIDFKDGPKAVSLPIDITGEQSDKNEKGVQARQGVVSAPAPVSDAVPTDPAVLSIKRLGCGYCYWESVSATNPLNPDYGYFVGGGADDTIVETKDGWKTFQKNRINDLTDNLSTRYRGDPILSFDPEGRLIIASLLQKGVGPINGGLFEEAEALKFPSKFEQTVLTPIPENLPSSRWIIFDYPRIAIDTDSESLFFGSKYISVNAFYLSEQIQGTGFITVRDGDILNKLIGELNLALLPNSLVVGDKGVIYASGYNNGMAAYRSMDGGKFFESHIVDPNGQWCAAKISNDSARATMAYGGPVITAGKKGLVFIAWARPERCVSDPNFEYASYGHDYDLFLSVSRDYGATWSAPLRVNDDRGSGDQFFPSIIADGNDSAYIAFLDHRDNQEKAQYDVYVARATLSPGGAVSISRNIKVNDKSVPNKIGGREPGDYLYMLSLGKKSVFVSYPCVSVPPLNDIQASDACISEISPRWDESDAHIYSVTEIIKATPSAAYIGDTVTLKISRNVPLLPFVAKLEGMGGSVGVKTIRKDSKSLTFEIPAKLKNSLAVAPGEYTVELEVSPEYETKQDSFRSNKVRLSILKRTAPVITVTAKPLGKLVGRKKTVQDDLGELVVTAADGELFIKKISINFQGRGIITSTQKELIDSVQLFELQSPDTYKPVAYSSSYSNCISYKCEKTWYLNTNIKPEARAAFKIRIDSTKISECDYCNLIVSVSKREGILYIVGNSTELLESGILPEIISSTYEQDLEINLLADPGVISPGDYSLLSWNVKGATYCTKFGGWSGSAEASAGRSYATNISTTTTYSLTCAGPSGSATKSVTVFVKSVE